MVDNDLSLGDTMAHDLGTIQDDQVLQAVSYLLTKEDKEEIDNEFWFKIPLDKRIEAIRVYNNLNSDSTDK